MHSPEKNGSWKFIPACVYVRIWLFAMECVTTMYLYLEVFALVSIKLMTTHPVGHGD